MTRRQLLPPDLVPVRAVSATVLFADLRNYTGLAERLPAVQVACLLDELFRPLTRACESQGGQLFHLAGDGLMAGFGIDQAAGEGAQAALAAGGRLLYLFESLGHRGREELGVETGLGVGVHYGEVAQVTLGPARHRTPTLVGDTVNVAARLCGRARAGELLFTETVATLLEGFRADRLGAPFRRMPAHTLRGRQESLEVWCLPAAERALAPGVELPVERGIGTAATGLFTRIAQSG